MTDDDEQPKGRSVPYWLQQACFARDRWTCVDCGFRGRKGKGELHCDHIIPRSRGGPDELDNVATRCQICHEKRTRTQQLGRRTFRRRSKYRKPPIHPSGVLSAPQRRRRSNHYRSGA